MKKILPILIALIGLGGGIAAGATMRPPPPVVQEHGDGTLGDAKDQSDHAEMDDHGEKHAGPPGHPS